MSLLQYEVDSCRVPTAARSDGISVGEEGPAALLASFASSFKTCFCGRLSSFALMRAKSRISSRVIPGFIARRISRSESETGLS